MIASPELNAPVDRELVLDRVLRAPRELVYQTWTDPAHLANWWGPRHFTNPVCEVDLRPGGALRIHMCGPDGTVYPMTGHYWEIEEPRRLVFTSMAYDSTGTPALENLNTVTFEADGDSTRLQMHAVIVARTQAAIPMLAGMRIGWAQTLDRLADHAACPQGSKSGSQTIETAPDEIVTTRVYDAPRELVYQAWTDPKHLAHWWGPRGFTTTVQTMDVRPGGKWQMVMHGPDGRDYHNKLEFLEVIPNHQLVYRHTGEAGSEPVSHESTVTFETVGQQTRVTMRMVFVSIEARDHVANTYRAVEGGRQTMDRLAEHLTQM
jgi:uncharacterized protein YndB with AHSA1/START domain